MSIFYQTVRASFRLLFSLCYDLEITGKENIPTGPALIAANHGSYYDPPLLGVALDEEPIYLMVATLEKPIFGKILRALHAYPVRGKEGMTTLRWALQSLQEGKKVVIFPEGQRTPDGALLPLQPGVASLALRSNAPIVPTWIEGTYPIWNRHRRWPHLGGKIVCRFGKPLLPEEMVGEGARQKREKLLAGIMEAWRKMEKEV